MEWLKELARRVGMLKNREKFDADLEEEMRLHMEMREREKRSEGYSAEDARYAAQRQFGNATHLKEVSREAWGWAWLEQLVKDFGFGLRLLRLNPAFTIAAVLSLALGIGANTSIFQLLNALRLRTLPVQNPHELVEIKTTTELDGASGGFSSWNPQLTFAQFEHLRAQQQTFTGVFAANDVTLNLATGGEVRNVSGLLASGEFFTMLGTRPHLGRLLSPSDDQPGCGTLPAVISHRLWQQEYGGSANVIGRKISADNFPVEIIGVTPPGFYGVEVGRQYDMILPLCAEDVLSGENSRRNDRAQWWLTVLGRMKPGVRVTQATAQLGALSPALYEATLPKNYNEQDRKTYLAFKLAAYPAGTGVSQLRQRFEQALWMLLGIAGLVLAIACANLANLMLARASAREREIAVRMALGASRWRLVRQLLSESLLLALAGAALGVWLATNLSHLLVTFVGTQRDRWFLDLGFDWRVFAFAATLALLTCFLFGLAPALRVTHRSPGESLKAGARGSTAGPERFGLRRALVVTQVALSLVLVTGAVLFSRSFQKLITQDTGLQHEGVLVAGVDFSATRIPIEQRSAFSRDLLQRIRAIPGALDAAHTMIVPLRGSGWNGFVWLEGQAKEKKGLSWLSRVSDGYFKTMGVPLLAGRDFDSRDTVKAPAVAIVTEAFARRFMNGANPVGQRFLHEGENEDNTDKVVEIVGLVRDVKYSGLREELEPIAFVPTAQDLRPRPAMNVLIRAGVPLAEVSAGVKRVLAEVNPQVSVEFTVFTQMVRDRLVRDRLMAALSSFFGALAALLAAIGLYGVIAYMVERRRNEIGIRMALGANRGNVVTLILREAAVLVAIGSALGTLLALAAGQTASSMLYGLQAYDALSMSLAVGGLSLVALAASFLPAYRAARMDPLAALRQE